MHGLILHKCKLISFHTKYFILNNSHTIYIYMSIKFKLITSTLSVMLPITYVISYNDKLVIDKINKVEQLEWFITTTSSLDHVYVGDSCKCIDTLICKFA